MHIDDRLATVLAVNATGDNQIRVQYRQLLDLIGTMPAASRGSGIDAAMIRLGELARRIPPAERADLLLCSGVRLRNPRLVAELASDHPAVAASAIRIARLDDEQWLDLLPALPAAARGQLRQRADLGPALAQRLDQLGAGGPGLPPPGTTEALAEADRAADMATEPAQERGGAKVLTLRMRRESTAAAAPAAVPAIPLPAIPEPLVPLAEPAAPVAVTEAADAPPREGIGAIVRRIEAFRRNREGGQQPAANDAPRLPLVDEPAAPLLQAFTFACDSAGRVCWADPAIAGMVVGLLLPLAEQPGQGLASAFRRQLPVRGARVELKGAPAVAGAWLLDAVPEFDKDGRFTGYAGKFRRPSPETVAAPANPEAVRVRQVLHELRTPVNAIQGFAELIHQQLVGPVPHGYRALAAAIASDAAQMLAGFDELERLARLDSQALVPETGEADLGPIVAALVQQLAPFTGPRQSGFTYAPPAAPCRVALAPAETERLGWRLLATLAAASRPGERLPVTLAQDGPAVTLALALPQALAELPDPAEGLPPAPSQTVSGGPFGSGFALRLAGAEARGAGGSLTFRDGHALLVLPTAPASRLTAAAELPNPVDVGASSTG